MEKALKFLKHMKQTDTPYNFRECELDEAIADLEKFKENMKSLTDGVVSNRQGYWEAMKRKTCEGCKHKPNDGECYYEPCGTCARFFYDHYSPKE